MTDLSHEASEIESLADGDSDRALTLATGVEVGEFGGSSVTFPPTCRRSCLTAPEAAGVEGACFLVAALSAGEVPEGTEEPSLCDRGHMVIVRPDREPGRATLFLHPSQSDDATPSNARCADQTRAAGALWDHIERLRQESQSLALELISSYEQLNVIFDITKRVGSVQDVDQIRLFLLHVLAETLSCDWACCVSHDGADQWWCRDEEDDQSETVAWIRGALSDVLAETAASRQILVRNRSQMPELDLSYSIMIGPLGRADEGDEVVVVGRRPQRGEFLSGDMRMLDSVLGHGSQVVSNLRLMERLKTLSMEAVLALVSAIDKKDTYTSGHSQRVGFLSRLVGQEMGLSVADLQDLEWAGILHDVGKIGISDGILTKAGGLTDNEFDKIRQHPRMSYEVIEPLRSFGSVRDAVLHHHETPDGQGYPDGLKGDEIPVQARIIHTTDTFDALTSNRSYRRGFPIAQALEIMRQDVGTKIDEQTFAAFEKAFSRFRSQEPERFAEMFCHIEELAR